MSIMYSSDGAGRWWRREWQPKCPKQVFLYGQCQGTENHLDVHWCFGLDGSFKWSANKKDPKESGCGSTPPGHTRYRSPQEMAEVHHLRFSQEAEVTDAELITMLELDITPEIGASINRPIKDAQEEMEVRAKNQIQEIRAKKQNRQFMTKLEKLLFVRTTYALGLKEALEYLEDSDNNCDGVWQN